MTRVTTTERMGDAQNPLSTRELIDALNDPSFNVRYEAIHSIGRMPPERELVDALLAALQEGQSELSFVIIQALGRLGDSRAVGPLRQLLDSGYHLLEAHSARALARLGDTDSIPHLLAKFRAEPNPVLRIAYVSALGTLRSIEALEEIFALLRQTRGEAQRGEIGLALARIAGDEEYYMQHWRSLRANPDTATAQAILALQKKASRLKLDTLADLAGECAEYFAQHDSRQGRRLLQKMIYELPPAGLDQALICISRECGQDLADVEDGHFEVLLLSLHTLDIALG
jgi:HEAT repeat protein